MTNPESKNFYITTAIDYVNARPHIGHALEKIQADVIARFMRQQGRDVRFLTGTDENALKNVQAAEEAGKPVAEFVAANAEVFKNLLGVLHVSNDDFIRTSVEDRHIRGAQEFWAACKPKDIYKKKYRGLYCLGCEEFKLGKDLVNGECPEHPGRKLEEIEEENYFFKLSNYQDRLLSLIQSGELEIIPNGRKNETLAFIEGGLEDFSISRSRERARNWGVGVPGDDSQVMYVWVDALSNYITALGYADDGDLFKKYWEEGETLHVIGKGINRFHTIFWPALLLSAGVAPPKKVFIHGYITVDSQKMSKTTGNVIDPFAVVEKYGTDAVRYYLIRHMHPFEDSDFTMEKFSEAYTANLVNGIGNLTSRIMKMASQYLDGSVDVSEVRAMAEIGKFVEDFELHHAMNSLWSYIADLDGLIQEQKPFQVFKQDKKRAQLQVTYLVKELGRIAKHLFPFMPGTSEKIIQAIQTNKMPASIFPRLG